MHLICPGDRGGHRIFAVGQNSTQAREKNSLKNFLPPPKKNATFMVILMYFKRVFMLFRVIYS